MANYVNGSQILALFFVEITLYGTLTAMEIPAELMQDKASLLKSMESYTPLQQPYAVADNFRADAETEADAAAIALLPPSAEEFVESPMQYNESTGNGNGNEQHQHESDASNDNDVDDNDFDDVDEADMRKHAKIYNILANEQHLQQQQPSSWYHMHNEPEKQQQRQQRQFENHKQQQPEQQQHNSRHAFMELLHAHTHAHTSNHHNNNQHPHQPVHRTISISKASPPSPLPPAAPAAATTMLRHCSIIITNKIPGVCEPTNARIGSSAACVSGEYMDVFNADCM